MLDGARRFNTPAAMLGAMLVLAGLILFVWPDLLIFIVATGLLLMGAGLIVSAWRVPPVVQYRRVDVAWSSADDAARRDA